MPRTLIIIPTLNEFENIQEILTCVLGLRQGYHILVVDDDSQDGTANVVEKLIKAQRGTQTIFLEKRKGPKGLGNAYIHGFKWALSKEYDYIVEMDADFSHNPKDISRLLGRCLKDHKDVAIGSRYVNNKVNVINWDMKRLLLSYFASRYVRCITGMPFYDTTAGFVCYHRRVLEALDLKKIKFVGYAFQIEMKYKAWKIGFQISEVPIVFTDRTKGVSKMNRTIVKEGILGVIQLRILNF